MYYTSIQKALKMQPGISNLTILANNIASHCGIHSRQTSIAFPTGISLVSRLKQISIVVYEVRKLLE